ncbi:hypothetical protein Tcan_00762, partial [Toxocara canis]
EGRWKWKWVTRKGVDRPIVERFGECCVISTKNSGIKVVKLLQQRSHSTVETVLGDRRYVFRWHGTRAWDGRILTKKIEISLASRLSNALNVVPRTFKDQKSVQPCRTNKTNCYGMGL